MKRVHWISAGFVLLLLSTGIIVKLASTSSTTDDLAALLPTEVDGYRAEQPDGVYDAETLFDYINGGAEVYRSFNVRQVVGRRYRKDGAPEIVADLFDMGSAADAYGAYHHEIRDGSDPGIGQEAELTEGYLAFWKGRFFVSIVAFDADEATSAAVSAIGRAIDQAIVDPGVPPDLVGLLPEQGLLADQVHYFHDQQCLRMHLNLGAHLDAAADASADATDLLALGPQTEGIVARYRRAGAAPPSSPPVDDGTGGASPSEAASTGAALALLIVRYPSVAEAAAAHARLRGRYLQSADADGIAQTAEGSRGAPKYAAARLRGALLIGVFDAPSRSVIAPILTEVDRSAAAVDGGRRSKAP
jgi:hypothetical protein